MDMLDPYLYPTGDNQDDEFSPEPELFEPAAVRGGASDESGFVSPAQVTFAQRLVLEIREKLDLLERLLTRTNKLGAEDVERLLLHPPKSAKPQGKMIEGVFDGEHMMGADGKQYVVPPNYASKSKLVEGDILKLTVTDDGQFIYKQIGPIDRQRIICLLARDEVTGDYVAIGDGKKWQILTASVTFFRAEPGDDVVVLVPKNAPSHWAAMENAIKKIEIAPPPKRGRRASVE